LAVPTTLGAVYGMNFDNIPELHWQYGYFALMAANAALMLVLYLIFRRIRWLTTQKSLQSAPEAENCND